MRALVLGLGLLIAQSSWALQGGENGCYGRGPLEPFELMRPAFFTYEQTCRIPTLVNDLIMKAHLSEIRSCWGNVLGRYPFQNIELPLAVTVSESRIEVLPPGENEIPADAMTTDLRKCLVDVIQKIEVPTAQIRAIGGPLPWYMLGTIQFGYRYKK